MEKTICPLPCIYTEFNKYVYVPMKPQSIISATRGWEYFAKDYLWILFPGVCYETHRLIQNRWESAKKFLYWEAEQNDVFFRSAFKALC